MGLTSNRASRPRDRRDTVEIISRAEFEEQQQQYSVKSKDPVMSFEPLKVCVCGVVWCVVGWYVMVCDWVWCGVVWSGGVEWGVV